MADIFSMAGGFDADAPDKRSYYGETNATLNAQTKLAPKVYNAEEEYQPKYAQLSMDILARIAPQYAELLKNLQPKLNEAADTARAGTVSSLGKLGPQMYQDLVNYDPMRSKLLDDAGTAAEDYMGGKMDPFLERALQQNVRTSQAARGFGTGGNDASAEALFLAQNHDAMRRYGIGAAQSVAGQRSQAFDPFLAALMNMGGNGGGVAAAAGGVKGGPALFNPTDPYAAAMYGMNYQGPLQVALANSSQQNQSARAFDQNMTSLATAGIGAA